MVPSICTTIFCPFTQSKKAKTSSSSRKGKDDAPSPASQSVILLPPPEVAPLEMIVDAVQQRASRARQSLTASQPGRRLGYLAFGDAATTYITRDAIAGATPPFDPLPVLNFVPTTSSSSSTGRVTVGLCEAGL